MIPQVRVKLKSLAAEARFIRTEERRSRRMAYHLSVTQAPALVIEQTRETYASLRRHRVIDVRGEARNTSLVYAMLRGKAYAKTEAAGSKPANLAAVTAMYARFGGVSKAGAEQLARAWLGLPEEDAP